MKNNRSQINKNFEELPWIDLYEAFTSEAYAQRVQSISDETLHFAASPANRYALIKSAQKSLDQNKTEKVDKGQAEILADLMSVLARMILQDRRVSKK